MEEENKKKTLSENLWGAFGYLLVVLAILFFAWGILSLLTTSRENSYKAKYEALEEQYSELQDRYYEIETAIENHDISDSDAYYETQTSIDELKAQIEDMQGDIDYMHTVISELAEKEKLGIWKLIN